MRLATILMAAMMITGTASFASAKGGGKFMKACKEENPGASKADLKKCAKEKAKASH